MIAASRTLGRPLLLFQSDGGMLRRLRPFIFGRRMYFLKVIQLLLLLLLGSDLLLHEVGEAGG